MTASVAAADDFATLTSDSRPPMYEICKSDRGRHLARPYYRTLLISDEDADDDFTCNTADTTVKRSNCKMPTQAEVNLAKAIAIDYLYGAEAAGIQSSLLIAYTDDVTGNKEASHAKAESEIAAMLKGKNDKLQEEYVSFLKAARVLQKHVASLTPVKSLWTFLTIAKSEADDVSAAAAAAGGGTALKKEPVMSVQPNGKLSVSPALSISSSSLEKAGSSLPSGNIGSGTCLEGVRYLPEGDGDDNSWWMRLYDHTRCMFVWWHKMEED